jgi:hypothetical protein
MVVYSIENLYTVSPKDGRDEPSTICYHATDARETFRNA